MNAIILCFLACLQVHSSQHASFPVWSQLGRENGDADGQHGRLSVVREEVDIRASFGSTVAGALSVFTLWPSKLITHCSLGR